MLEVRAHCGSSLCSGSHWAKISQDHNSGSWDYSWDFWSYFQANEKFMPSHALIVWKHREGYQHRSQDKKEGTEELRKVNEGRRKAKRKRREEKQEEDAVTKSGVPGRMMIKCHTLDFLDSHLVLLLTTPTKPGDGHGCCRSDIRFSLPETENAAAAAAAESLQSCPTLCDPRDGSPSGSPVPGILQARTREWVAISSSNAWKWKVKVKSLSRVRLLAAPWTAAHQAPPPMGFSRHEYWSGVPLPSPNLKMDTAIQDQKSWSLITLITALGQKSMRFCLLGASYLSLPLNLWPMVLINPNFYSVGQILSLFITTLKNIFFNIGALGTEDRTLGTNLQNVFCPEE